MLFANAWRVWVFAFFNVVASHANHLCLARLPLRIKFANLNNPRASWSKKAWGGPTVLVFDTLDGDQRMISI